MLKNRNKQQSIRAYLLSLLLLTAGSFFYAYNGKVESYNSTVLAFSYKYGFTSRSLIGTIYQALNAILPLDLMNYEAVRSVTLIVTILIFLILGLILRRILLMTREEDLPFAEMLGMILSLMLVMTFVSKRNLGRLDIYMILLSMISILCLMKQRAEWLVILLSGLSVCVHQGSVFMYANLVLVLLLYLAIRRENSRKKYLILFGLTFLTISILFLWFEFFSRSQGTLIVDQVISDATKLSLNGNYHKTLIDHEVLGIDLAEEEWNMHLENFVEIPIFLLLFSPFLYLIYRFVRMLFLEAENRGDRLIMALFLLGPLTLLPNYILKVDYGRWDLALFVYYLVMTLVMMAMGEKVFCQAGRKATAYIAEHRTIFLILLIYLVLFFPFWDVHVNELCKEISNPINETWLHIW